MTSNGSRPNLRRRWNRLVLRTAGQLDSQRFDRFLPWMFAAALWAILLALNAAAVRSLDPGSGLAPWLQAVWRRENGWAGSPMAGVDPARGSGSLISEPILWLARLLPPEAVFAAVQSAAIALTVVALWRLTRAEARLTVAAATVISLAFALAPTLHRANLSSFHPELIALPALLWAYINARRDRWWRFGLLIALTLSARADMGITVAALGGVLVLNGKRKPGAITSAIGLVWSGTALALISPDTPERALTPAGEFVARATTPLAVIPRMVREPVSVLQELVAEPSVLFLVVVLSPLLFMPLLAPRLLLVATPCLALAMVADRAVQRVAEEGVLDLAPAAAHIGPAMGFVFVGLVFALERMGEHRVTRVAVDRRILIALLAGASLLFVTESPTSPYRQPWSWGSRDARTGALLHASEMVEPDAAVASSPAASALVAERGRVIELAPNPTDLTDLRIDQVTGVVDVVILDASDSELWTASQRRTILQRFSARGFVVTYEAEGIHLLERSGQPGQSA